MNAISKAIDPARTGLSKSLMTSPCERKGFYTETVRDAAGRRLSFPMPERVTFGTAVDEAVTWLLWMYRKGDPDYDIDGMLGTDEGLAIIVNDMRIAGLEAAQRQPGWALVADPVTFTTQLATACRLYLTAVDGFARIVDLFDENLRLQGDNGRSLRAGDVIGTPDFLTDRRVGDLKTWGRNDGAAKVWKSPEMGIYAYLFAAESGALPESVFYQAYVRSAKPYWIWIEVPATADLVAFGRATADHWRALLEAGNPDLAAYSTSFCGDCPFRLPIPEVGHDGCAVGRLVPVSEEVAA